MNRVDYQEDEALVCAAEELTEERLALFDAYNEEEHVFSRKFEQKRKQLGKTVNHTETSGKRVRRSWKTAVCFAALIALLAVPVGAIPAVRQVLVRAVVTVTNPTKVAISFIDTTDSAADVSSGVPGWLPEGYSLAEVRYSSPNAKIFLYERGDGMGKFSLFVHSRSNNIRLVGEPGDFRVENPKVMIGEYEGVLIQDEGGNSLIWSDTAHSYILGYTSLTTQEAIRIAESVK